MIQPFEKIEGVVTTKYRAIFASDSIKNTLENRERFMTLLEMNPWDKVINCDCDCKGFKFGKGKWCKHIYSDKFGEPGMLQLLLQWGEISTIPENEQKAKDN